MIPDRSVDRLMDEITAFLAAQKDSGTEVSPVHREVPSPETIASAPEFRRHEKVCEVTGLVFNGHLPRSPYVEQDPETGEWTKQAW